MISTPDALTIHQLLGRIVYFHTLFVAPGRSSGPRPEPGPLCCNHGAASSHRTVDEALADSAWSALIEVAIDLPAHHRPCPDLSGACCATCCIAVAAGAVARGWAEAEWHAFRQTEPAEQFLVLCGRAAAARLGAVFAAQHALPCPALERITAAPLQGLPGVDELPLTGELLALWAAPAATTDHPVASWLNHCTGLDDIRRVLKTRRTTT
ncbi:hypothetical protein ACWEQ1_17195 [Streptomyces nodosus]